MKVGKTNHSRTGSRVLSPMGRPETPLSSHHLYRRGWRTCMSERGFARKFANPRKSSLEVVDVGLRASKRRRNDTDCALYLRACSGWHCRPHGFHCAKPTTPESPSGNVMTSSAVVGWSARPTNFAQSQGLLVGRQDQPTLKQPHASASHCCPSLFEGYSTRASSSKPNR